MAYLHRLVIVLALLLLPQAHASFPATRTNPDACTVAPCELYSTRSAASTPAMLPYLSTKLEACERFRQDRTARNIATGFAHLNPVTMVSYASTCHTVTTNGTVNDYAYYTQSTPPATPTYSCPANSTLSGDQCTCDATYTQSGNTCVPPSSVNNCQAKAGQVAGRYEIEGQTSGGKKLCEPSFSSGDSGSPGCLISGDPSMCVRLGDKWHCEVTMRFSGAKCAPDASASTDVGGTGGDGAPGTGDGKEPATCPSGKVPGSVNGTHVCVDPGTNDTTKKNSSKTDTTTNADGSTTRTDQETSVDCSGPVCTTTTTTTTTTTPAGGGTPSTETTTNTGTCTRGSSDCGNEESEPSRFGGSCSTFTCEGDAIQCAIALEQHKRNCQLFVDASPESELYEAEKGKTGPQYTSETVNLGPSSFSQANALGGSAQCITDKTVTIWKHQVVLPFSQVCGTLQHLGTVLMFISFLVAYRIVSRG